ncbi:mitochondrial inner membrane protein [Crepidotus variabilis]|uniref:Succinate dehydrogenase [ubiquinone] cytochrome b small subunit n=1 Tax=Crepidotus variabilis TaxID=179855 RepID=A0A9P6E8B1_9AGAR|nr:mitochondrial inner membrane protein [Crepidotus variabilis]
MSSALLLRSTLPRALAARHFARSSLLVRHASTATTGEDAKYKYVPGGPILQGTVNDPTTFPPPNPSHGSYHWAFERLLSAALVPMSAAAFVGSANPSVGAAVFDGVLGLVLVMHCHIGFDASVVDYLHPRKFPVLGQVAKWGLRGATVATLVGVYQFNTNDVGLTELIAKVWTA